MVPWNSASGGFAYFWQSQWVGIIAIKTERTQIHFLSYVLVAVESLDLKVHIFAGKRGTRHHSATGFSENVLVAETSYQMLEVLSYCKWERAFKISLDKSNRANYSGKKTYEAFRGVHISRPKNLKLNLFLESKSLYYKFEKKTLSRFDNNYVG